MRLGVRCCFSHGFPPLITGLSLFSLKMAEKVEIFEIPNSKFQIQSTGVLILYDNNKDISLQRDDDGIFFKSVFMGEKDLNNNFLTS